LNFHQFSESGAETQGVARKNTKKYLFLGLIGKNPQEIFHTFANNIQIITAFLAD